MPEEKEVIEVIEEIDPLEKLLDEVLPNTEKEDDPPVEEVLKPIEIETDTNISDDNSNGIKTPPDEPNIKEEVAKIKKDLEESNRKNIELEKIREEARVLQDNNLKLALIDKDISDLEREAVSITAAHNDLITKFNQGSITTQEYTQQYASIHTESNKVLNKFNELNLKKQSIPTIEQYRVVESARLRNNEYFKNVDIKDDLVKKHVEKLKKDHYDQFGVAIEDNPTFKQNSAWIESIIKEAETRGYQKATEKIQERITKGKAPIGTGSKGANIKKVNSISDILKASPEQIRRQCL